MHKSATKCNETIGKWCKNKHGASKIIDTFETYQPPLTAVGTRGSCSASSSPSRSRPRALGWRRRLHQSAPAVRFGVQRRVSPSCTSATPSRCHRLHLRGYSASASRCTVSWDCPWRRREVIERELAAVDDLGEFTFDGSDI
jgi:hypothetical protein